MFSFILNRVLMFSIILNLIFMFSFILNRILITVTCVTYLPKDFLDSNFNSAIIGKTSSFHQIAPNFTKSQKL